MLDELERRGLLDHTLVVVTSDHGLPFPRAKGQAYDASNHVPLALMWRNRFSEPGRVVDACVSFIDLAPTFIALAGLQWEQTGMASTPGRSLTGILFSEHGGRIEPQRDWVLVGKERIKAGWVNDSDFEPRPLD